MTGNRGKVPAGIELRALTRWLQDEITSLAPPLQTALISGGRSNLTYELTDAEGTRYVLRRPPLGELQATAHDVRREWQIVSALEPTPVPVAHVLAWCDDASVIGAPFFVMGYVPGLTPGDLDSVDALAEAARSRLGDDVTSVLAGLHEQEVSEIGLAHLVRPGHLIDRQLRRWGRQLETYPALTSPLIRPVQAELEKKIPAEQRTSLVHGDYKLTNFRVDTGGKIVAVLDWELTAVGDPLVDVGWLLASWAEPRDSGHWITTPPTAGGGFPDKRTLTSAYAAKSGLDLSEIGYYVAFAYWRWACINEGIRARFAAGVMGESTVDLGAVAAQICWQLESAWQLLTGGEDGTPTRTRPAEVER